MTDAQKAAFKRIQEIAREHFHASVFIAEGDAVTETGGELDGSSDVNFTFHGGFAASIGLCRMAELKVYKTELDASGD